MTLDVPQNIRDIADLFDVSVLRDTHNCPNNRGASAGQDIYLGKFDDTDIELIAFFHELGHTQSSKLVKREWSMTTVSDEGLAWELGLGIARELGYKWDYYAPAVQWAREQLETYRKEDHNWK